MLDKIKIILNISDTKKDNLLNIYIEQATFDLNGKVEGNEPLLVKMVVELYNHRFAEGITSQSISGLSTTYSASGYSQSVQDAIRKVVGVGRVVFL